MVHREVLGSLRCTLSSVYSSASLALIVKASESSVKQLEVHLGINSKLFQLEFIELKPVYLVFNQELSIPLFLVLFPLEFS